MSDPSLSPFARELMTSCKGDAAPERGAERMLTRLGVVALPLLTEAGSASAPDVHGPSTTGAVPTATGSAVTQGTVTKAVLAKWIVVASLGGAVAGASGYHVARQHFDVASSATPPSARATVVVPAGVDPPPGNAPATTSPLAPPSIAAVSTSARVPSPAVVKVVSASPAVSARASAASAEPRTAQVDRELAREMAQVSYARSLVEQRRYAEALQAVAVHRANLGKVLEPEMRALEIEATFGLGGDAEGRKLAQSFLDDHPRHPAAPRVRGLMRGGGAQP